MVGAGEVADDFASALGPVQTLKSGDVFYEPPNALHAISRNASATQPLRYLLIQVSDPTKPATVPE